MAWTIEDLKEHLLIGSTLVEGSTLSEGEARAVLAGRTVQGHAVREIRELTNYRWATEWLMETLEEAPGLTIDMLCGYHARLMNGLTEDAGRFKTYENYTVRSDGVRFDYLHPSQVTQAIADWLKEFNCPTLDAVRSGAALYARFQAIHPFSDGNGRIGRVLLAYYLQREAHKLDHLRAIEASDVGDLEAPCAFIRVRIKH